MFFLVLNIKENVYIHAYNEKFKMTTTEKNPSLFHVLLHFSWQKNSNFKRILTFLVFHQHHHHPFIVYHHYHDEFWYCYLSSHYIVVTPTYTHTRNSLVDFFLNTIVLVYVNFWFNLYHHVNKPIEKYTHINPSYRVHHYN